METMRALFTGNPLDEPIQTLSVRSVIDLEYFSYLSFLYHICLELQTPFFSMVKLFQKL